ncbi:MAG: hypothetical protein WBV82_13340 [Myxococcaceae bacterium]
MKLIVGRWRSPDHPDAWPQATSLMVDEPPVVLCATGMGGGSQQATFREQLDPVLMSGIERWRAAMRASCGSAHEAADALFAAVQAEFEELPSAPRLPADHAQASAVALVGGDDGWAVVNSGLERAYLVREGSVRQVSVDRSMLADAPADADLGVRFASFFRLHGGQLGNFLPARWQVAPLELRRGDVLVLGTGWVGAFADGEELAPVMLRAIRGADATEDGLTKAAAALGKWICDPARLAAYPPSSRASFYARCRISLAVCTLAT